MRQGNQILSVLFLCLISDFSEYHPQVGVRWLCANIFEASCQGTRNVRQLSRIRMEIIANYIKLFLAYTPHTAGDCTGLAL
jgi:hypothetical protein